MKRLTFLALFYLYPFFTYSQCLEDHRTFSISYPHVEKFQGVVTLAHGLNQRPEMLYQIRDIFLEQGLVTNVVSMQGHREHLPDSNMPGIKVGCWEQQVKKALEISNRLQEDHSIEGDHIFLGFSLGGLVGVHVLNKNPDIFDRGILLAPAIEMRFTSHLIKILNFLDDHVTIPTPTRDEERAARGSSLLAYKELFRIREDFLNSLNRQHVNIPMEVIVHKRDELVSAWGLRNLIRQNDLDQWQLSLLDVSKKFGFQNYYHQITVPDHIGQEDWSENIANTLIIDKDRE